MPVSAKDDLSARGYTPAYSKTRNHANKSATLLHKAFPGLFPESDDTIWHHRAGEVLVNSVRRAIAIIDQRFHITSAKEAAARKEIVLAIKQEFSEAAVRALVETQGKGAAIIIAERALWRIDLMRTGKRPNGGTEP